METLFRFVVCAAHCWAAVINVFNLREAHFRVSVSLCVPFVFCFYPLNSYNECISYLNLRTQDIYHWPYSRLRYWEVARFRCVLNRASDKRLLLLSWLSSHLLPAYYRESCLDFSAFSSVLAVCLSTLSKPNLTHRIESHCKNNKKSSKQARFAWIFYQYCPILTFTWQLLLYIKV